MAPKKRTGDPEIGRRLKTLRLRRHLLEETLGAQLDPPATQQTISNYETGAVDVSTGTMRQLAKLLKTTVAYLYGETDDPSTPAERLRRAGIQPGNLAVLNSEQIQLLVAAMVDELKDRALHPTNPPGGQGEPIDNQGDEPAANAGG